MNMATETALPRAAALLEMSLNELKNREPREDHWRRRNRKVTWRGDDNSPCLDTEAGEARSLGPG